MTDLLLIGGIVVDGTGALARRADVAVTNGRIAAVGDLAGSTAARTIDVAGRLVCPGFIDPHCHSDLTLLSNVLAQSAVRQGATTQIVGNCGLGVTGFASPEDTSAVRAAVRYLDVDPDLSWTWTDQASYFRTLDEASVSINVGALVGHVPVRIGAVGLDDREASTAEMAQMRSVLAECLDAGALGFSTGLGYAPACYASNDELAELARVVADRDKIFAWHLRDYGDDLIASANQAIEIAEATGCRTQISHLVAVGSQNWGSVDRVLDRVEEACRRGADVGVDVYPYTAGNTMLSQLLPEWAQEGGEDEMRSRAGTGATRQRVKEHWVNHPKAWSDVLISSAPGHEDMAGTNLEELAAARGTDADEIALDLLAELGNAVGITAFGRSDDDVRSVLRHRCALVGSDGLALDPAGPTGRGTPHPRSYGCYPRMFAKYAGEELPVERIVRMSTGAVAERFGIADRGLLLVGQAADVAVLDPSRIQDLATYTDPHRFPSGIELVIVNGVVTVEGSEHAGSRSGLVLRR